MYSSLTSSEFTELVEAAIFNRSEIDTIERALREVNPDIDPNACRIPIDTPISKGHLEGIVKLSEEFNRSVNDIIGILNDHGIINYIKVNSMWLIFLLRGKQNSIKSSLYIRRE